MLGSPSYEIAVVWQLWLLNTTNCTCDFIVCCYAIKNGSHSIDLNVSEKPQH